MSEKPDLDKENLDVYQCLQEVAHEQTKNAFEQCANVIDSKFGQNYALKNPSLVSALLEFQQKTYIHVLNSYYEQNP